MIEFNVSPLKIEIVRSKSMKHSRNSPHTPRHTIGGRNWREGSPSRTDGSPALRATIDSHRHCQR